MNHKYVVGVLLCIKDYTITKVDQVTHHQSKIRCNTSRDKQCLYMSLISVCLTFKSLSL